MMLNQISTKDPFSINHGGDKYGDDAAAGMGFSSQSFSQLPDSQNEFSQLTSQDFFSQPHSGGSQTEGMKLYQKYVAQPPLFRPVGQLKNQNKPGITFQHQELNKAKAKEKDERDLLNYIATTVKDCSEEVKIILKKNLETMNHMISNTDKKVDSCLIKILHELNAKCDAMMSSLQTSEDKTRLCAIEKEVDMKNTKIKDLENKLLLAEQSQNRKVLDVMKQLMEEHKSLLNSKIQGLSDTLSQHLKQSKEHIVIPKSYFEKIKKCDLLNASLKENKDVVKRILKAVEHLPRNHKMEFTVQNRQLKSDLHGCMIKEERDLKEYIHRELGYNSQRQRNETEQVVKSVCDEYSKKQEKVINMLSKLETSEKTENSKTLNTLNYMRVDIETLFKHIKVQLEKLEEFYFKSHFQGTLDTMIHSQKPCKESEKGLNETYEWQTTDFIQGSGTRNNVRPSLPLTVTSKSQLSSDTRDFIYQKLVTAPDADSYKHKTNLSSPNHSESLWNSKYLFSKSNLSPVATVLPQKQNNSQNFDTVNRSKTSKLVATRDKRQSKYAQFKPQRYSKRILQGKHLEQNIKNPEVNFPFHDFKQGPLSSSISIEKKKCLKENSYSNDITEGVNKLCSRFGESQKMKSMTNQTEGYNSSIIAEILSASDLENNSSKESSPSLSIVEAVIKRKIKFESRNSIRKIRFDGAPATDENFSTDLLSCLNSDYKSPANIHIMESRAYHRSSHKGRVNECNFSSETANIKRKRMTRQI